MKIIMQTRLFQLLYQDRLFVSAKYISNILLIMSYGMILSNVEALADFNQITNVP